MGVTSWSRVPAENATADPLIPARQNAAARDYIDSVQGVMAGVASLAADQNGAVTTGTGNSYAAQSASGIAELAPGLTLYVVANRSNTGASTLRIDDTGEKPWRSDGGGALQDGDIVLGRRYAVSYHADTDTWRSAIGVTTDFVTQALSTKADALTVAGKAAKGANTDITSLSGLTTPLSLAQGGLGAGNAVEGRANLGLGSSSVLGVATTAQAQAGIDASSLMTPALVREAVAYVLQQPGLLKSLLPTTEPSTPGTPWLNGDFLAIKS